MRACGATGGAVAPRPSPTTTRRRRTRTGVRSLLRPAPRTRRPSARGGHRTVGGRSVLHGHRRTVRLRPRHRCRAGSPVEPHHAERAERPPAHRRAHVRHRRDPPPRRHRGVVRPGPHRAASPGTGRARRYRRRARAHRGRPASDRRATDRRARRTTHAGTGPRPVGAAPSPPAPRQADSGVPTVRAPVTIEVEQGDTLGRPASMLASARRGPAGITTRVGGLAVIRDGQ